MEKEKIQNQTFAAEEIIKSALLDFYLAKRNEEGFRSVLRGEDVISRRPEEKRADEYFGTAFPRSFEKGWQPAKGNVFAYLNEVMDDAVQERLSEYRKSNKLTPEISRLINLFADYAKQMCVVKEQEGFGHVIVVSPTRATVIGEIAEAEDFFLNTISKGEKIYVLLTSN